MDDETRFERYLAEELDDMAGPGRRIDAMAMTRASLAAVSQVVHPRLLAPATMNRFAGCGHEVLAAWIASMPLTSDFTIGKSSGQEAFSVSR